MTTIGPWVSCIGPIEAMVLLAGLLMLIPVWGSFIFDFTITKIHCVIQSLQSLFFMTLIMFQFYVIVEYSVQIVSQIDKLSIFILFYLEDLRL